LNQLGYLRFFTTCLLLRRKSRAWMSQRPVDINVLSHIIACSIVLGL